MPYWINALRALLQLIVWRTFLPAICAGLLASCTAILLLGASAGLIAAAALHPPLYTLAVTITLVRACGISRAVLRYLDRWLSHRAAFALLTQLRLRLYTQAEHLLPAKVNGPAQGSLLHDLICGTDILRDFYLRVLSPVLQTFLLTLLGTLFLLPLHPLAPLPLLLAWLLSLLLPLITDSQPLTVAADAADTAYRSILLDYLGGREELFIQPDAPKKLRLDQSAHALHQTQKTLLCHSLQTDTLLTVLQRLLFLTLFVFLAQQTAASALTGIELAIYVLALQTLFAAFAELPAAIRQLLHTRTPARLLLPLQSVPQTNAATPADNPADHSILRVEKLCFSYTDAAPLLENLSFCIQPGEKVAIIGESGCGKTTLFHLLLHLWEPDAGQCFLFGIPYARLSDEAIRQHFGACTQTAYLFNLSIRQNFQRLHPGIDDKTIWHNLQIMQMKAPVQALPEGLDTLVGEDGINLSGGQRQRLLLALAFASPASLLLLDEPTAGLDQSTATKLMNSLLDNLADRTLLLITHELPQAKQMDRILYLPALSYPQGGFTS